MSNPSTFHWTYEDYVRLGFGDESFEFIDGRRLVSPVPNAWHQFASQHLGSLLAEYLREKQLGLLLHPPFDTIFADDTMLQPDIAVLLNEHGARLKEAGLFGAPDFVIEVLSPSTASRDRREKLSVYARYGVREYWLVDAKRGRIEVFVLESGDLVKKAEHESGEARSLAVLPGFAAPLSEVFRRASVTMSSPSTFHWTYQDYVRLTDEGESFEFIDGKRFVNPQPTIWHQIVSGNLAFLVKLCLRDQKLGVLLHPPVDTVFADDTVLQPDIAVLLDEHRDRLREAGLFGAPDFVIEILSPSTASRDRREKLSVYARYGVREYWLVDPERQRIMVFVLESGRLVKKAEHDSGEARSLAVLPGFSAPLADVFERP